ncbi:MAG TPA: peptidylprolyl isomerase [Euzebya sp.]|nr:peptidylprolyl isomerase [Euzebya sp.]
MHRFIPLLLVLVLLTSACGQALGNPRVAAVINGEEITVSQLQPLIPAAQAGVNPQTGAAPSDEEASVQALSNLVLLTIIHQEVEALGGERVMEPEIDAEIEEAAASAGGQEAFEQGLAAQGTDLQAVRGNIEFQLAVQRLTDVLLGEVDVSDEEVQAVYDSQFGQPGVSHILVASEEEALDARQRIEEGEDFAAVAQDVSTDPGSAANGGELGPLRPGAFVPEFEEAALALEPGEVSDPVQSQFGFHLITTTEPQALDDDLRAEITDQVSQQQVQGQLPDVVFTALEEADAEINPRFGVWAPEVAPDRSSLVSVILPTDPLGELVPVSPPGQADPLGLPVAPPTEQ